ncbi:hypothetical protein GCM10025877_10550 [Agromyces mangrovi Wang et al. 2018]|nr:hypothetical protein GCM10025877_10550 [Agromyces mangrovi]
MWEFPGGKVESGERPESALQRELLEELGVEVQVGDLIDRSSTTVGALTIDLATYWVSLVDDHPTESTDHDQLEWLSPEQLPTLEWAEPDLPAVLAITRQSSR